MLWPGALRIMLEWGLSERNAYAISLEYEL